MNVDYAVAYQNLLDAANQKLTRPLKDGFRMEGHLSSAKLEKAFLPADAIVIALRASGELKNCVRDVSHDQIDSRADLFNVVRACRKLMLAAAFLSIPGYASTASAQSSFYDAPRSLLAGKPGTLVRQERLTVHH